MSGNSNNFMILGLLMALGAVMITASNIKKKIVIKEPYQDLFYAKDMAKDNWVARPDFKADLSPRFDSTRVGGGNIIGDFPGMDVQGAPLTPVESVTNYSYQPSFATMGGDHSASAYDPRLPAGGLSTTQVNEILTQKFGRSGATYTDTKALLPTPDMRKSIERDPSDSNTFMYDRYLFAENKRRYGKTAVDFIRGDLPIEQIRTGWFDVPSVARNDLVKGYFSDYLDIQQSLAVRDAVFERAPTPVDEVNPWGGLAKQTVYSVL